MAEYIAAKSAIQNAVVKGTNVKQTRAWLRFTNYLSSIGCQDDPFLENFTRTQRNRILAAFAHSVREG